MAGVTLGFLKYVLGLDTISFRKGMTEAERDLVKMQKSFEKRGQQIAGIGKTLSVGLTLPLTAFAAKGIKEAQETARAMGQINAAIESMGPVAGRTGAQLAAMADKLELNSLYEADEILSKVSSQLLAFGNVHGQVFDRAQQSIVDYASRSGKDLQAVTIAVGKALNDPIKGMAGLSKVGIQLTDDQKKLVKQMIETGNAAGAQDVILRALETRFRGAAAAAQNTDPWNKATDAFNQMAEKVGTALLPLIPPLTNAIVSVANAFASLSPETQKWVLIIGAAAVALGPLLTVLGTMITVMAQIGPLVLALSTGFKTLAGVMTLVRVAGLGLLPALTPILVPLGLIAAAVGAVYLAWKNWDKIGPIVNRMVAGVSAALGKMKGILTAVLSPITTVTNAFRTMYDKVVGNSYVPDMVDEIGAQMARLDAVMVTPAKTATTKAAQAFQELESRIGSLLNRLFPEQAASNQLTREIADLEAYALAAKWPVEQLTEALKRLKMEGLTDEGIGVASQGSLVPSDEDIMAGIGAASEKMGEVVDKTRDWRDVVSQVAVDLANIGGDFLSRMVEGSVKLKDLWRTVLSYAIQFFTSSNSPFMSLFGGARAMGGPVSNGKTYLVGENGPELFTPSRSGSIIPNHRLGGGMSGGWSGDMHVYANDADSFRRSERQLNRDLRRRIAV